MGIKRWEKVPLKTLCSRIGDGLHGTPKYAEDSDIFFINGNNLKKGKILLSQDTKKVADFEWRNNYIELNNNSLLLSINGTIGEMAFYNNEKVMLGKSTAYLNFRTGINSFYYYYFQLKNIQQYFYRVATGSTIKNLGLTSIQEFEVPYPNVESWSPITKILSELDKKIELNNKINTKLEAMAKLIYDYWFVQFDFPDEHGKPYKSSGGKMIYNEEIKREIPDSWKVSDIAGVTESIKRGISPDYTKEEGLRVINQRCVRDQTIDFSLARTHGGSMCSDDPRVIQHWDVLVNSTGVGTLGRVAHVKVANIDPHVTDSHVTTLRASVSKITKPYFAYTLKRLQPVIEAAANGSTGQVELSRPYLEGIKFVIPEHGLQKKFGAIVSQISEKQALAENETQELTKLRDWLLPMLMNGQVTVK